MLKTTFNEILDKSDKSFDNDYIELSILTKKYKENAIITLSGWGITIEFPADNSGVAKGRKIKTVNFKYDDANNTCLEIDTDTHGKIIGGIFTCDSSNIENDISATFNGNGTVASAILKNVFKSKETKHEVENLEELTNTLNKISKAFDTLNI